MNTREKLLQEAVDNNIKVVKFDFAGTRIKGLYCDNCIAIDENINRLCEGNAILCEEMGHHFTCCGDILDQTNTGNRKQEYHGRVWGYNKAVGLTGIVECFKRGYRCLYEMADYLEISEEYLLEALNCYKSKYAPCTQIDNYIIYFDPLGVLELYK